MSSKNEVKLEDEKIGVLRKVDANTFVVRGADPKTKEDLIKSLKEQNDALEAEPDKFGSAELEAMRKTTEELEKLSKKF